MITEHRRKLEEYKRQKELKAKGIEPEPVSECSKSKNPRSKDLPNDSPLWEQLLDLAFAMDKEKGRDYRTGVCGALWEMRAGGAVLVPGNDHYVLRRGEWGEGAYKEARDRLLVPFKGDIGRLLSCVEGEGLDDSSKIKDSIRIRGIAKVKLDDGSLIYLVESDEYKNRVPHGYAGYSLRELELLLDGVKSGRLKDVKGIKDINAAMKVFRGRLISDDWVNKEGGE